MSTATSSPRYLSVKTYNSFTLFINDLLATTSTSPTSVPSTSTPTTSSPSSNYPSLSPSIGIITTIAGTGSTTYSGDNGQATDAGLNLPLGVRVDAAGENFYLTLLLLFYLFILSVYLGNVYIADLLNNRIRKVTVSTGIITTIAGTGSTTYSGDNGQATAAALYYPTDLAVDAAGICYDYSVALLVALTFSFFS